MKLDMGSSQFDLDWEGDPRNKHVIVNVMFSSALWWWSLPSMFTKHRLPSEFHRGLHHIVCGYSDVTDIIFLEALPAIYIVCIFLMQC